MVKDDTPNLDPLILERNLAALREVDPELAQRLADLPDASGPPPMPARTRDGRLSFRLKQSDGWMTWFGRTSIPGVRAAALLDRFDAGRANVFFPGMGEGSEVEMLLPRLGAHRAIFVWEPDPVNLKLALRLHDLAAAISAKRLVLMTSGLGQLADALYQWLMRNPGHLCPNQMMMFPWQTPAEIAPIRFAVEQAYQRTERDRQTALAQVHHRWRTMPHPQSPAAGDAPAHVLILALHALDETWSTADALSVAAAKLGWHATVADIRTPGDMHSLARARRVLESPHGPPSFSILLNVIREQVCDVIPAAIPVVCWLSHRGDVFHRARLGAVAVTSPVLLKRALAAGIDQRRLSVCPLPCLGPVELDCLEKERPLDVLLITDAGPIDAAAIAPRLPGYAQLWKGAADLLATQIETFTDDQAERILSRTEAKARARIDEPQVREEILRNLTCQLAPSLLCRFLAGQLKASGLSFRIHGPGWTAAFPEHASPPLTTIRQKVDVLRCAKVVIHADVTGLLTGDALLAAGCGAAVIARRHPSNTLPGGLETLLAPDHEVLTFLTGRELIQAVRRLLEDAACRCDLAAMAVRRCLADHMPEARLETLKAAATSVF
ncbi:MAG TPA: glycosyltransferase [Phycisphaerae bacterium]|nr:glycosyltransferase [Phycisphaerae bacterium]HRR83461.1 glycosyltransferase [Phycisphaerae bacterium]